MPFEMKREGEKVLGSIAAHPRLDFEAHAQAVVQPPSQPTMRIRAGQDQGDICLVALGARDLSDGPQIKGPPTIRRKWVWLKIKELRLHGF